jgi:hypothetical protein
MPPVSLGGVGDSRRCQPVQVPLRLEELFIMGQAVQMSMVRDRVAKAEKKENLTEQQLTNSSIIFFSAFAKLQ